MSTRIPYERANKARGIALAFSLSFLGGALPIARAAPDVATEDDPSLAQYRERFKQGLDRYEASDIAGALSYWEPLYRDLGPSRGFRVGYNLARAYEVSVDLTRAAERYESFLGEVKKLRDAGKPVDDVVASDELKARARLDEITRTRARIRIPPTTPPESVRIDQAEPRLAGFIAYVAPGGHDIVFAPDTPHARREHVDAQAGQLVEIALPKIETVVTPPPNVPVTIWTDSLKRPFSPTWLWLAGVATIVVGGGITGGAYANAVATHDRYASQPPSQGPTSGQVTDYQNSRALAYASWAVPATLVVATIVLAVWYAVGSHHVKVARTALAF